MNNVFLMSAEVDAENKIVAIAKLSHGGNVFKIYPKEEQEKFINKLFKWKHFSPFEHASATFFIDNVSLNLTHQLVRHRLFSFLQKSRRYTNDTPDWFIMPDTLLNDKENAKTYHKVKDMYNKCKNLYKELIEEGVPPEDARFVLPTATPTAIVVTGNYRQYMHFFKLRLDKSAQWEIREVAEQMFTLLGQISPFIFNKEKLKYYE